MVEEQLRSWLGQIRRFNDVHRQIGPYVRLAKLFDFLLDWDITAWNEPAADHFQRLRADRVRIGSQDLKIACIAPANDGCCSRSRAISSRCRGCEWRIGYNRREINGKFI